MPDKKSHLIIIDGHGLIHRAFHALPPLSTKDGTVVNAVFGFTTILLRVLKELKPTHAIVAFDPPGKTFRHKEFPDYKAHRVKQPDELYRQIPIVSEIVHAFSIPIFQVPGMEADDVIGTIVEHMKHKKIAVTIVTGDMDTLQLVNDHTTVYTLKRSMNETIIYDQKAIEQRYGFSPERIIEYKALRGDPSDNIPGVSGIGEKRAIELVQKFQRIESLYDHIDRNTKKAQSLNERIRNLLASQRDQAFLSKRLVTIRRNVNIDFDLEKARLQKTDPKIIAPLFQKLEFKSLLPRVIDLLAGNHQGQLPFHSTIQKPIIPPKDAVYQLIDSEQGLKEILRRLLSAKQLSIDTETTSLNIHDAELLGIAISDTPGRAWFIDWTSLRRAKEMRRLIRILENPNVKKIGHHLKFDIEILHQQNIHVHGLYFDTMIASYLLSPGSRNHGLDAVVYSELGHEMIPLTALIKRGKSEIPLSSVPKRDLAIYSCEDADFTFRLVSPLMHSLQKDGVWELFQEIEMPLIPVLASMEERGVKIDPVFLAKKSKEAEKRIQSLKRNVFQLAGASFNISSPIQLRDILFLRLRIPTTRIKKTKTGFSTASLELKKLQRFHPIITAIEEYREYTKLKSTYLDALPRLMRKKTHRVHTHFNQTVTATGRLSSNDPNLQNIPVRTEEGQEIRKAFIAESGKRLVSLDYSQLELRIAAHLSRDKKMIEFFHANEDIHRRTAAEIHHVPYHEVTKEMRRGAKEINFGVIYGMGPYGLSARAGISFEEAKEFIERYFSIFSGLKQFIEQIKETAAKKGYVETVFGRRRHLPDLKSTMPEVKAAAERMAVNFPIQGTESDMVKKAMIEIHELLLKWKDEVFLLLQVHDELVFEVKASMVKEVAKACKTTMEQVVHLSVPIVVECEVGKNWGEGEPLW